MFEQGHTDCYFETLLIYFCYNPPRWFLSVSTTLFFLLFSHKWKEFLHLCAEGIKFSLLHCIRKMFKKSVLSSRFLTFVKYLQSRCLPFNIIRAIISILYVGAVVIKSEHLIPVCILCRSI